MVNSIVFSVGQIKTWNGLTHLPWWKTEDTSDLRGTCDGTIQKPGIQKTDTVVQFQSFLCRYCLEIDNFH